MRWIDLAGPPGSGKSTLADALWHPHAIAISNDLPPASWHCFLNEVWRLLWLVREHPTFDAALRMNRRSVAKIATVSRVKSDEIYIQTALVQRGLGFGWRLNDMGKPLDELRHYFRLMPVSLGVVFTKADVATIVERNHKRELVKATAHENRDFMVPLMLPAIEIAKEVLRDRGVPIREIDVQHQSPDEGRKQLIEFAGEQARHAAPVRPDDQMAVLSPPPFWR